MSEFSRVRYRGRNLVALNIVRRFRNLFYVSDNVKYDGHTIDEFIVSGSAETSTSLVFPREEPTNADFGLWNEAIHQLCNGATRITYSLGEHLHCPHLPTVWFTTDTATYLYRTREDQTEPR
jgi:hypothetical protein